MIREWAGVPRPRCRLLPTGLRPFYRGLRDRRLITASSLWIRSARTSAHVKGYQIPSPSPDSAARSVGRRLISLRGGNCGRYGYDAAAHRTYGDFRATSNGLRGGRRDCRKESAIASLTVSVTHIEMAARSSLLSLTAMCRRIPIRRSKIGAIDKIIFGAVRL